MNCKDCKHNDTPFHKDPCKTCRAYAPYKVKFDFKDPAILVPKGVDKK